MTLYCDLCKGNPVSEEIDRIVGGEQEVARFEDQLLCLDHVFAPLHSYLHEILIQQPLWRSAARGALLDLYRVLTIGPEMRRLQARKLVRPRE